MQIDRIYGVDFSGGEECGKKIWITLGEVQDDQFVIQKCSHASEWFDIAPDKKSVFEKLSNFVQKEKNSLFAIDFPFSVPVQLMDEDIWEDFILSFAKKFKTPEAFREHCRKKSKGKDLHRTWDVAQAKPPFSPYNLRLYRQTYYGMLHILFPMVKDKTGAVLPIQRPLKDKSIVIEICPASTLKDLDLYISYKGKEDKHRKNRELLFKKFTHVPHIKVESKDLKEKTLEDTEGDALDSLIAAATAYRNWNAANLIHPEGEYKRDEGFIYL